MSIPNIIYLGFDGYSYLANKLRWYEQNRVGVTVFSGFAPETITHPWAVSYGVPVSIAEILSPYAARHGMVGGGWYDADAGVYLWETVRLFESWDDAAEFGKAHGQKAIFNILTGEEMSL